MSPVKRAKSAFATAVRRIVRKHENGKLALGEVPVNDQGGTCQCELGQDARIPPVRFTSDKRRLGVKLVLYSALPRSIANEDG